MPRIRSVSLPTAFGRARIDIVDYGDVTIDPVTGAVTGGIRWLPDSLVQGLSPKTVSSTAGSEPPRYFTFGGSLFSRIPLRGESFLPSMKKIGKNIFVDPTTGGVYERISLNVVRGGGTVAETFLQQVVTGESGPQGTSQPLAPASRTDLADYALTNPDAVAKNPEVPLARAAVLALVQQIEGNRTELQKQVKDGRPLAKQVDRLVRGLTEWFDDPFADHNKAERKDAPELKQLQTAIETLQALQKGTTEKEKATLAKDKEGSSPPKEETPTPAKPAAIDETKTTGHKDP